mmetsp:Transcript_19147/g.21675  ORF Transcript_19147/g.21675 Transcript_19147/m.21675 type:complete len:304 (+) Transcript_19147:397-1308(+)
MTGLHLLFPSFTSTWELIVSSLSSCTAGAASATTAASSASSTATSVGSTAVAARISFSGFVFVFLERTDLSISQLFVVLDTNVGFLGQLKSQVLEFSDFLFVSQQSSCGLIPGSFVISGNDHLTDDTLNFTDGQVHQASQRLVTQSIVQRTVFMQKCFQSSFLNFLSDHFFSLSDVLSHFPNLKIQNHITGGLPVSLSQSTRGSHDSISLGLGRTDEQQSRVSIEESSEGFVDDLFVVVMRMRGDVGDFQNHSDGQVNAFKQFQIDVVMVGNNTLSFFLFQSFESTSNETLSQTFLKSTGLTV